jgi:hypothetical protein
MILRNITLGNILRYVTLFTYETTKGQVTISSMLRTVSLFSYLLKYAILSTQKGSPFFSISSSHPMQSRAVSL